jgi:predicted DsbA family dithiol-disulfide isomerase
VSLRTLADQHPEVEILHHAFILLPLDEERTFTEYYLRHRRAAGEMTGLPYHLPEIGSHYPTSSLPALEAAEWVKEYHREQFAAYDLSLYEAFFRETRDISTPVILVDLAARLGLPGDELRDALARREYRARVFRTHHEAEKAGVTLIPTVVIGRRVLPGVVPAEQYDEALQALGAGLSG